MASKTDSENKIFKSVRYYLIGSLEDSVKKKLSDGGAKAETYLSPLVTHAFLTNNHTCTAEQAADVFQIPVITPDWVLLSDECRKLLPTKAFNAYKPNLFQKCLFCFSQLSKKDKESLWGLITAHGGRCQSKLDEKCTHLIVAKPLGDKYNEAIKHPATISTITPDWVVDTVNKKIFQDVSLYNTQNVILPETKEKSMKIDSKDITDKITENTKALAVSGNMETPATGVVLATVTITMSTSSQSVSTTTTANNKLTLEQSKATLASSSLTPTLKTETSNPLVGMSITQAIYMKQQMQKQSNLNPTLVKQEQGIQKLTTKDLQQIQKQTTNQQVVTTQHLQLVSGPSQQTVAADQQLATNVVMQSRFPLNTDTKLYQQNTSANQNNGININNSPLQKQNMKLNVGGVVRPANQMVMTPNQQSNFAIMSTQNANLMSQQTNLSGQCIQQTNNPTSLHQRQQSFLPAVQQQIIYGNPVQQHQILQQQHIINPTQQQNQSSVMQTTFTNQGQPQQTVGSTSNVMNERVAGTNQQTPMEVTNNQLQQPHVFIDGQIHQQQQQLQSQQQMQMQQMQQQQQQMQQQQMQQQQQQMLQQQSQTAMFVVSNNQQIPMQTQHNLNQHQSQQQQPITPSSGNLTRFPSSTSLEAAGMSGISPIALQQGLLNAAQMKPDQPALVHPSLQGELFPKTGSSTTSGNQNQKKKSRARKKTTESVPGEAPDAKQRPKARTNRKKSTKSSTSAPQPQMYTGPRSSVVHHINPGGPFPFQPNQAAVPPQYFPTNFNPHEQVLQQQRLQQQQQLQVLQQQQRLKQMTLAQQQQSQRQMVQQPQPQLFQTGAVTFKQITPQIQQQLTQSKMMQNNLINKSPRSATTPSSDRKMSCNKSNAMRETVVKAQQELIRHKRKEESRKDEERREQTLGRFIDPLTLEIGDSVEKDLYKTHDSADKISSDLCLLGCIFMIDEYDNILPPAISRGMFKNIIPKFGGVMLDKENISEATNYTHLLCATQTSTLYKKSLNEGKRCVTIYWLHDVLALRQLRPPWLAVHVPVPYSWNIRPASKHVVSTTGFHQKERELIKSMIHVAGGHFTSCLTRNSTVLICKKLVGLKHGKACEWNIPCVTLEWLRDILSSDTPSPSQPDEDYTRISETDFERVTEKGFLLDVKRASSLLDAWKTPLVISEEILRAAKVKKVLQASSVVVSTATTQMQSVYKPFPRISFTGFQPREVIEMKSKLSKLSGCRFIERSDLCTHLISKKIVRTQKFLSCVSSGSHILSHQWVEDSVISNGFVAEDNYGLIDSKSEEVFKFSLKESLKRARAKPIFWNCIFFLTSKIQPDHNTLSELISCGGGCTIQKLPTISELKHLQTRTDANRNDRIFIVSCPADHEVYQQIKREGVIVHNVELILTSALKQQLDEELYRL